MTRPAACLLASLVLAASLPGVVACRGAREDGVVRMAFAPSRSPATMLEAAEELARFVSRSAGIELVAEVPPSYGGVVAALSSGRADVAWLPPFAYLIAHERSGADARLQVVRVYEQTVVVVVRDEPGAPRSLAELAGREVAVPASFDPELRRAAEDLLRPAPGWRERRAADDRGAVRMLLEGPGAPAAALSSQVASGPADFVGDGRKELEAVLPGTLRRTRILASVDPPLERTATSYRGCILTRTDSGIRTVADLDGRSIAYTDAASTSGSIFPRVLLQRAGVTPGAEYLVGGHPTVVAEVLSRRVAAGATYWSAPGAVQRRSGELVADARGRAVTRLATDADRQWFLERVRVVALTASIPSDVCCVRDGLPAGVWDRLAAAIEAFLALPEGREVLADLVGGAGVAPTSDASFDELRETLHAAGVDPDELLRAEEARLGGRSGG